MKKYSFGEIVSALFVILTSVAGASFLFYKAFLWLYVHVIDPLIDKINFKKAIKGDLENITNRDWV